MTLTSEEEAKAELVAANARCYALETKLGGLAMEHRAAQRKMAKELDSRVRNMDSLRAGVDAELRGLKGSNKRLRGALAAACAALAAASIDLPAAAAAELSVGNEPEEPRVRPAPRLVAGLPMADGGPGGNSGGAGARRSEGPPLRPKSPEAQPARRQQVESSGNDGQTAAVAAARPAAPDPESRDSKSPLPFKRFTGKRAVSPSRGQPPEPGGMGGSAAAPPTLAAPGAPMALRRWTGSDPRESARPVTPTGRAIQYAAGPPPPAGGSASGDGIGAGAGAGATAAVDGAGGMSQMLQERRNSSRDAAAQKHQARLRAVRTSSRGKWGFSV